MFATIYSTLANTIRNVGRAQDGSEVIDWFVDSRANVLNVAISATVEKNGERVQCEAELLGNQHIIHQKYIHYWGYKTETALILPEGKARNEIWAYFAVPDDQYMKNAEFRFDCNKLSTTWLPISLRRGAAPPT